MTQPVDLLNIALRVDGCLDDLPSWHDATPVLVRSWSQGYIELAAETWEVAHDVVVSGDIIAASIDQLNALAWQTINDRQRDKESAEACDEWNYDRNGRYVGPSETHFYYAV